MPGQCPSWARFQRDLSSATRSFTSTKDQSGSDRRYSWTSIGTFSHAAIADAQAANSVRREIKNARIAGCSFDLAATSVRLRLRQLLAHRDELLGRGWVDADGLIELPLSRAAFD